MPNIYFLRSRTVYMFTVYSLFLNFVYIKLVVIFLNLAGVVEDDMNISG